MISLRKVNLCYFYFFPSLHVLPLRSTHQRLAYDVITIPYARDMFRLCLHSKGSLFNRLNAQGFRYTRKCIFLKLIFLKPNLLLWLDEKIVINFLVRRNPCIYSPINQFQLQRMFFIAGCGAKVHGESKTIPA